jgi:hypothetical protein
VGAGEAGDAWRRSGLNGARSGGRPGASSASRRWANGPTVKPEEPRPLPTSSPSMPAARPSGGQMPGPIGRKPIQVSMIVALPSPGATSSRASLTFRIGVHFWNGDAPSPFAGSRACDSAGVDEPAADQGG